MFENIHDQRDNIERFLDERSRVGYKIPTFPHYNPVKPKRTT